MSPEPTTRPGLGAIENSYIGRRAEERPPCAVAGLVAEGLPKRKKLRRYELNPVWKDGDG